MIDQTSDTFFNGRLQIRQHRRGYRFSIDAVLLANHVKPRPGDRVLDLGTGCGIIPLIIAYRFPDIHVYAIEIQKALARLATLNIETNRMADRIRVLHEDLRAVRHDRIHGPVDIVISNPPYRKVASGRINPDRQRAVARHELKVTLVDIAEAARRLLRTAGRLILIYPADRSIDVFVQMRASGIEPKTLRTIHSKAQSEAKLILVEGVKDARPGIAVASPLIIYQDDGTYSKEVEAMF